jgi:DnaK suppressor protein
VAARKPAAVKRPVAAKKAVNAKAAASVKPAARPAVAAARKPAGKKPVAEAVRPPVRPAPFGRVPVRPSRPARKGKPVKKLSAKELARYRKALLDLRDQVVDDISFLAGDNLNRSQRETSGDLSGYSFHMADQGTDNYDREFALNLVSSEQDVLYEIDEAIRRMDNGTYGVCELSGEPIERARLNVLPYARCSVAAQSELERGRTRYRPFGPTLSHGG